MGRNRYTFRMNEQLEVQLEYILQALKSRPELYINAPRNMSELINTLLNDYCNLLIQNFKRGKNYNELLTQLNAVNSKKALSREEKLLQSIYNKLSVVEYISINTNQGLVRANMEDWKNMGSIYEHGTSENDLHTSLAKLVESDKKDLMMAKNKRNRKMSE